MPQQYTVKAGDTLSTIGSKYGVPYSQITGYKSGNPNLIQPGEVLTIPDPVGTATPKINPVATPQVVQPVATPQVATPQVSAPQMSGNQPRSVQDLISMGYGGYQGWGDAEALADFRNTGGSGKRSAASNSPYGARPTINLQSIYDTAFTEASKGVQPSIDAANSEMAQIQARIEAKTKALAEAEANINDNPYFSEATRSGRIAKLRQQAQADLAIDQQALAFAQDKLSSAEKRLTQAKADAEVKLNIANKQYDIEDTQYRQNLELFNNLLTTGALNNISGTDIAQIAQSTGMTTSMIQSIIDVAKKAKEEKPKLETIDDGTNQYVVAFDSQGNVINKQVIGNSKPKAQTSDQKANSGNFTNAQVSKAIKILAEADLLENPNDTGDKLLSATEQQQALLKIQSEIVPDPTQAFNLLQKAAEQGGFGDWTG